MLTFYLPKLVIVGCLWGSALVFATWLRWTELEDPTYNYIVDTSSYYVSAIKLIAGFSMGEFGKIVFVSAFRVSKCFSFRSGERTLPTS